MINSVMDGFNASRVGHPERRSKPRLLNRAGRSQSPHLKALPAHRGGDFSTTDLSGTSRRGDWPAPKNQPRTLHSTSPLGSEVLRLKVCSPDRRPQSPRQFSGCTEEGRPAQQVGPMLLGMANGSRKEMPRSRCSARGLSLKPAQRHMRSRVGKSLSSVHIVMIPCSPHGFRTLQSLPAPHLLRATGQLQLSLKDTVIPQRRNGWAPDHSSNPAQGGTWFTQGHAEEGLVL